MPFSTWDSKIPKLRIRGSPRAKYQVGEQIKRKRAELGMTQDDVATFLDVDIRTLIAWELGAVPLEKQTPKLIEFLGHDPYEEALTI